MSREKIENIRYFPITQLKEKPFAGPKCFIPYISKRKLPSLKQKISSKKCRLCSAERERTYTVYICLDCTQCTQNFV